MLFERRNAAPAAVSKEFTLSDQDFIERHVNRIPGWLEDYTARRTMDLLKWQEGEKVHGPLLEIGVFAGRYFSILLRSAAAGGETVLGIDTFQYAKYDDVIGHHLAPFAPIESVAKFYVGPSTSLTSNEVLALMGGERPRFISVDGSHELQDVFSDLRLSEDLLGSSGIVAVDDYLNPLTLGVNQAVNIFFSQPRNLAPFAYVLNKLFLTRLHHASAAREFLEQKIRTLTDERSKRWVSDCDQDRNRVEAMVFGHRTLIVG